MQFMLGSFYTHRHMLDLCVYVIAAELNNTADAQRLVVSWHRKKNLDPIGVTETITIQAKDLCNWRAFE
jgi:hypothetical protein